MMVKNGVHPPTPELLDTTFTSEAVRYLDEKKELLAQKQNWQWVALGAIACCTVLAGGITFLAVQRPAPVPYIVEVAETGQVRNVGFIPHAFAGPSDRHITKMVQLWLQNVRRISEDPMVMGEQWREASSFTAQSLHPWLQTVMEGQRKRFDAKKKVEFTWGHMLPIAETARSFKVTWSEKAVDIGGQVVQDESGKWEATVVVAVVPPEEVMDEPEQRNPLGMFVTECHWARVQ